MANKVLVSDLVLAVSEITSLPKSRCEDYLKAFFEAIASALATDGIVKVKGLGTFKLISVEERKSVNVQTGTEMVIPAHNKVSFTPDKILKDEINKPYSHLKTYVLNNNAPLDPPETDEDESDMEEGELVEESAISSNNEVVIHDSVEADIFVGETVKDNDTKVGPTSHSDWYDNWEVEYDSSTSNSQCCISKQVTSDEKTDGLESATEATVENKENNQIESNSVTAQNEKETELSEQRESDIPEDSKLDEPLNEICSNDSISDAATAVKGASVEPDSNIGLDNSNEQGVALAITETENNSSADSDEKTTSLASSVPTEKPKRKKTLGISIVAFIIVLIAVIVAIANINPDFFKSLKATDNPQVQPTDSTSLSQELSAIQQEDTAKIIKTDTIARSTSDATAKNSTPEKEVKQENKKTEVSKETVVKSVDPLWSSSFVSYMKRKHSDCILATSGLKGETTIQKGTYLTMVALENYGDKSYWIYLYLYNKDRIKNPNNVTAGTKVRIPVLDKSLANGTDPAKIALANEVRQVFIK